VIIQTERLVLRPFTMRDVKTTFAYANNLENTPYMMEFPHLTKRETRRFLKRIIKRKKNLKRLHEFAVTLQGAHIGAAGVYLDEDGRGASVGWIIHRDYWGKGYATEAATAVMDYARELGVISFCARCDERNLASRRVAEKLGMTLESRFTGVGQYKHGIEEEATELKFLLR